MLKLVKNLLLIIGIVFILDKGLGNIIQHFFYAETQGDASKTTYMVTRFKQDLLILGSSRAAHHYVSKDIESKTGLTSYNAGRDGLNMSYYYILMKAGLALHKPKIIILDINLQEFVFSERRNDIVITTLLPYINKSANIREYIFNKKPVEGWKATASTLYRFNSTPISIIQHHLGIGQKDIQGYEPLYGSKIKENQIKTVDNKDYKEDSSIINEFDSFIQIAQKNNIDLYVMISPSAVKQTYDCVKTASRILEKYNLRLLDYSKLLNKNDMQYFNDGTHLNNSGAEYYTELVIKDILNGNNKIKK